MTTKVRPLNVRLTPELYAKAEQLLPILQAQHQSFTLSLSDVVRIALTELAARELRGMTAMATAPYALERGHQVARLSAEASTR